MEAVAPGRDGMRWDGWDGRAVTEALVGEFSSSSTGCGVGWPGCASKSALFLPLLPAAVKRVPFDWV